MIKIGQFQLERDGKGWSRDQYDESFPWWVPVRVEQGTWGFTCYGEFGEQTGSSPVDIVIGVIQARMDHLAKGGALADQMTGHLVEAAKGFLALNEWVEDPALEACESAAMDWQDRWSELQETYSNLHLEIQAHLQKNHLEWHGLSVILEELKKTPAAQPTVGV